MAGGAIDVMQRTAHGDQPADGAVEMALLGNIERIAVIGAEREEGREPLGYNRHQCMQVLRHRALADEDGHALGQLFTRFGGRCGFVVGADGGGEIAVERLPAQKRRVAVDMAVLEGNELGDDARIGIEDAGEVHHFGQADDLGVRAERFEIGDFELRARGLEAGGRHAG